MKYFFILGNNPALSVAEISAVFPAAQNLSLLNESILILETDNFAAKEMIKKIGGTIKIGVIKAETSKNKILEETKKLINTENIGGKFNFGFSFYGNGGLNLKVLGMETKKYLREKNVSCRWVTSKEKTLSSVVVEQNKLTKTGIEVNIIEKDNHVLIGQTLAVQPFKELSARDYGRPARDDLSGMLPPKLAQIMINLASAKPEEILLDPFCGSGTILTEAMLMGYKNLIGSDLSLKAVEDTKKNITWITNQFEIDNLKLKIFATNAAKLSQEIKSNSINTIITEPYLGPQRGKVDLKKTVQELENLYTKSLEEFSKILKSGGRIVMIWPVFQNKYFLNPKLNGFQIKNPLPGNLQKNKLLKLTPRHTIVYGREGQKVWREIVILGK